MVTKNKDESTTDIVSNRSANESSSSESKTNVAVESSDTTTATTSKDNVADSTGEHKAVTATNSKHIDVEGLNSELMCSICTELFVKAVTLNCSHTFCEQCIDTWREKKDKCPICRAKIKTVSPTNVVEKCVGKIIESASEETKRKRKRMIEQRNLEPKSKKRKVAVPIPNPVRIYDNWDDSSDDSWNDSLDDSLNDSSDDFLHERRLELMNQLSVNMHETHNMIMEALGNSIPPDRRYCRNCARYGHYTSACPYR